MAQHTHFWLKERYPLATAAIYNQENFVALAQHLLTTYVIITYCEPII